MAAYIARINIVVEADRAAEACDAVSAAMSENLMASGALIEWAYAMQAAASGDDIYTSPRRSPVPTDEFRDEGCGTSLDTAFDEAVDEMATTEQAEAA